MKPEDLMQKYEKALASQNWLNVSPLMHDDVTVTFSSGTFIGKAEVQEAFENNFSTIKDEKYFISKLHWVHRENDSAVCVYDFSWKGIINGKDASGSGSGTSVLIKVGGLWKIISENLDPKTS